MKTLTISDLSLDKTLDAKAMAEVTGGRYTILPYPLPRVGRRRGRRPGRRTVVKNVQKNNINFGTENSFIGITSGVNNGTQTINGGINF